MDFLSIEIIDEVAEAIRSRTSLVPKVGMILGSGLGEFAEEISSSTKIMTADLPHWPKSTVEGHAGRLILGEMEDQKVMVMQGRAHFYEGYSMPQIGLPVRVMKRLGAEFLFVTNAAGAVNSDFEPGDLMLLTDHINLVGMTGLSPLRGPNLEEFGPRFPDVSRVYDRDLHEIARNVSVELGIKLQEGVYVCLAGPAFETPADLRFLRGIGVDAVGMSTVPEATVARHSAMRVMGVSGISNKANLDGNTITTHEEVLEAGHMIAPKLSTLIKGVLRQI
ncbi:MAG: purine-nucleoside phosphorylase [Anaerolineales bacterium]|nr:purine-nucleoside phosphorylase [Anaerolineales bacterium]